MIPSTDSSSFASIIASSTPSPSPSSSLADFDLEARDVWDWAQAGMKVRSAFADAEPQPIQGMDWRKEAFKAGKRVEEGDDLFNPPYNINNALPELSSRTAYVRVVLSDISTRSHFKE